MLGSVWDKADAVMSGLSCHGWDDTRKLCLPQVFLYYPGKELCFNPWSGQPKRGVLTKDVIRKSLVHSSAPGFLNKACIPYYAFFLFLNPRFRFPGTWFSLVKSSPKSTYLPLLGLLTSFLIVTVLLHP